MAGAKSYVDIRVAPSPNEWRQALEVAVHDSSTATSRIWIYDVKRQPKPLTGVLCKQPWKRTPVVDSKDFRFAVHALPLAYLFTIIHV